jgi:hypothetical protein
MVARPLQRFCGLLLALGIVLAPATVPAQDGDPQVVTAEEREELERLLARLGFFPGPIDGVIDDKSRTAIRGYQDFAALPVDGEPSAALLAELRGLAQLMAELDAQQPEPATPSRPEPSIAPAEPPVAEPLPQVPTDSIDLDEPTTADAVTEPGGDGTNEVKAAPEPVPSVIEAPPPKSVAPLATLEPEAAQLVTRPPPAPRKPAQAPAPPAEPSAPLATENARDPAPAEAAASPATPQEPPSPPAPAGTLLEQIVAAIDNPPTRPSQPPAPAPEAPAPSAAPDPAPDSDPYQVALAPFLPRLAAGQMSKEDLAQTFNDRGKVQFVKGLYDQAIADYDLAIRVKPDFAEAHHNRGVAHEALGDFAQAKTDFEAAKRLGFSRPGAL